jgi:hypothetical protein
MVILWRPEHFSEFSHDWHTYGWPLVTNWLKNSYLNGGDTSFPPEAADRHKHDHHTLDMSIMINRKPLPTTRRKRATICST